MNTIDQAREPNMRVELFHAAIDRVAELEAELADERIRGLQLLADAKEWQQMLMKERAELATIKGQQPVAWRVWIGDPDSLQYVYSEDGDGEPLFLAAGAQPAPVIWAKTWFDPDSLQYVYSEDGDGEPLYAAPLQAQERKPLTKEQMTVLWNQKSWCVFQIEDAILFYTRSVEAAHGIGEQA